MKKIINKPLVSFLLPVYNDEKFLAQTLDSIIEQTYENFEVIAINDGSKDGSLKILKQYQKTDKRIKIVSRENKGLVATLNEAIQLSSGELLARIDSDDLCLPRRIEWQVQAMNTNSNAILCYGFYETINEDCEFLTKEIRLSNKNDIKRMMYINNPIAHSSVMLRKKMLPTELYNPNVGPTEDYELWSRLAINHDFVCVPRVMIRYRLNTTGIMHTVGSAQHVFMPINISNYWENAGAPRHYTAKEIRKMIIDYVYNSKLEYWLGVQISKLLTDNESQLAVKCFKRGYRILGLRIFLSTMLSSKTGFKSCFRRLVIIAKNNF